MKSFGTFLNLKDRENKKNLSILRDIFEKSGFGVTDFLSDRKEPYIYIHKPQIAESLSFGGVRIYTRGKDIICYRVQNKEYTQPFGSAYHLDVTGMFRSMIKEDKDKVGEKIAEYLVSELKDFFIKSAKYEKENEPDPRPTGIAVLSTNPNVDYNRY